jgi:hypothetical protein
MEISAAAFTPVENLQENSRLELSNTAGCTEWTLTFKFLYHAAT